MSKVILEFNLPEENDQFKTALNGNKYSYVLHELDTELRKRVKYAPEEQPEVVTKTYQEIRDLLWEYANQENIEF